MKRRPLFPALAPRRLRPTAASRTGRPPWWMASPLRTISVLVLLALGAALGSGLYEYVRRVAGFAPIVSATELAQLREQNQRLLADNDRLQASLNAAEGRLVIERAAKDQLVIDLRAAQKDSGDLRNDLAFFEQLIPADPRMAQVNIRSAEIEPQGASLRYRVLLMRGGRPSGEFRGTLQFSASGTRGGTSATIVLESLAAQPSASADVELPVMPTASPAPDPLALKFRQYQRAEGMLVLPAGFIARSVTVRVLEGSVVRSQSTVNLPF